MKKKKNLLFIFTLFAIFGMAKSVYAYGGTVSVKTTIQRWTPANDIVFRNDSCSSATLSDGTTTVYLSCDGTTQKLGFTFDGSSTSWQNYEYKFQAGSSVILTENYDFSGECEETLCVKAAVGTINAGNSLSMDFTYNENDLNENGKFDGVVSTTFANYHSADIEVYYDKVYGDESYLYFDNGGKSDEYDCGEVLLPVYIVKYSFSATGNLMPSSDWSVSYKTSDHPYELSSVNFDYATYPSVAEGSSPSGTMINRGINDGNYYSKLRAVDFYNAGQKELVNVSYNGTVRYKTGHKIVTSSYSDITYSITNESSGFQNYQSSSYSNSQSSNNSSFRTVTGSPSPNSNANTYFYELNADISASVSVPNGLFYNVIPFLVIIAIAGIGIVVIKRNSVKE